MAPEQLFMPWKGVQMTCEIRRSARRQTVALQVRNDEIVLRAPVSTPLERLQTFLDAKRSWVTHKLELSTSLPPGSRDIPWTSGRSLYYMGRQLRLIRLTQSAVGKKMSVQQVGRTLEVYADSDQACRELVVRWYRARALELLRVRVRWFCHRMALAEPVVQIRESQKRWGSCDANKILRFNWRIVMAPLTLMDYVVAHELCHLKAMNHSLEFWRHLELILPDYQKRCFQLEKQGSEYNL